MSVEKVYLVISADRRVRVAKRPQVRRDEVMVAINLNFPNSWGRTIASIDVDVPDFAPDVAVEEPDADEETAS